MYFFLQNYQDLLQHLFSSLAMLPLDLKLNQLRQIIKLMSPIPLMKLLKMHLQIFFSFLAFLVFHTNPHNLKNLHIFFLKEKFQQFQETN